MGFFYFFFDFLKALCHLVFCKSIAYHTTFVNPSAGIAAHANAV
jgi:hypothetical protein